MRSDNVNELLWIEQRLLDVLSREQLDAGQASALLQAHGQVCIVLDQLVARSMAVVDAAEQILADSIFRWHSRQSDS